MSNLVFQRHRNVVPTTPSARVVGKRPSNVWDAILDHDPSTLGRDTVIAEAIPAEEQDEFTLHHEYLSLRPAAYSTSSIV